MPMPPPRPPLRLICDTGNNQLIDLDTKVLVWDFSTKENCLEALAQVQNYEPFCEYQGNTSRTFEGKLIWDFNNEANCQEARQDVLMGGDFCDYSDNTLRRADGTLIFDFNIAEDCRRSKNSGRP